MSEQLLFDLPGDIAPEFSAFHRRLRDIQSFQLDRLRGATSAALLQEYEAELSEAFADVERRLQTLQLASDDYDRASEARAVSAAADDAGRELGKTRQASREALLAARRGLAARNEAAARAELALGGAAGEKTTRSTLADRSTDDKLHTASEEVTDALRRTVALMSQELEKSTFSAQMLDESSSALRTISLEYTSFSSLVKSSTQLIKSMERQDLYDRLMVLASLGFFLLCVGYILKVRVWDRGASLIAFLFRALTFGFGGRSASTESVMTSMQLVKAAAKSSVSSSAAAVSSAASASASAAASLLSESAISASLVAASALSAATAASAPPVYATQSAQIVAGAESTQPSENQQEGGSGQQGGSSQQQGSGASEQQQPGEPQQPRPSAQVNLKEALAAAKAKAGQKVYTRPVERNEL